MGKQKTFNGVTAEQRGADTWEWYTAHMRWILVGKNGPKLYREHGEKDWLECGKFNSLEAAIVWSKGFLAGFGWALKLSQTRTR